MRDDDWLLLTTVPGALMAEQLKEVLEEAGIPTLIQGDYLESVTLVKGLEGGRYDVYVPREAYESAREAVSGMLDEKDLNEPDRPQPPRFFG